MSHCQYEIKCTHMVTHVCETTYTQENFIGNIFVDLEMGILIGKTESYMVKYKTDLAPASWFINCYQ